MISPITYTFANSGREIIYLTWNIFLWMRLTNEFITEYFFLFRNLSWNSRLAHEFVALLDKDKKPPYRTFAAETFALILSVS